MAPDMATVFLNVGSQALERLPVGSYSHTLKRINLETILRCDVESSGQQSGRIRVRMDRSSPRPLNENTIRKNVCSLSENCRAA